MKTFFTGDRHAQEPETMLQPGDPLYDRIQRIRDHLAGDTSAQRPAWMDALESYQPTHARAYPETPGASYSIYPGGFVDRSGSLSEPPSATNREFEIDINRSWAAASPEMKAAARAAAETIIEGSFTFVGETDA